MIANHIHDALSQVRRLQALIVERRLFRGYSGTARILSGGAALAGSLVLDSTLVPDTPSAHLGGWMAILLAGMVLNYGALAHWFFFDPRVHRKLSALRPVLNAVPSLAAGFAVSLSAVLAGHYDMLFGIWIIFYGLAQTSYRGALPRGIYFVGLSYMLCGAYLLLSPFDSFTQPLLMGSIFCVGEMAGGWILLAHRQRILPRSDNEEVSA